MLKVLAIPEVFNIFPISDSISGVAINGAVSRMFLCCPWDGVLMWANQVSDRHLP